MPQSELYVPLWTKHLKVLKVLISNAKVKPQSFPMSYAEFHAYGERNVADYKFNMDIDKGKVKDSQIKGSAVARDLHKVLMNDIGSKAKLNIGNYNFNVGNDYRLIISLH